MRALDEHGHRLRCAATLIVAAIVALGFDATASADPPNFAWSESQVFAPPLFPPQGGQPLGFASVSCAGSALCVAVSADGRAFATGDLTAGTHAWTDTPIDAGGALLAVSCPSSTLCVAGDSEGRLLTSTNPGAAQPTWSSTQVSSGALRAVSCATPTLCVAVDEAGDVLTSTDAAGAGTWTASVVDAAGAPLLTVRCPSSKLCVGLDSFGDLLTSRRPADGEAAWSIQRSPDPTGALRVLSCASDALCIALNDEGTAYATSAPADGAPSWHDVGNIGLVDPVDVTCSTVERCVVVGGDGEVAASDSPADGSEGWGSTALADGLLLTGTSCASDTRCLLVDRGGRALLGDAPAAAGTVHVTLFGEGDGTISAPGLSCDVTCDGTYPRGSQVTLTPVPSAGSAFTGWGGACVGSAPCAVTVGAATTITAGFAFALPPPGFRLSVSIGGMGWVAGAGIACPETCTSSQRPGTVEALTATAAAGWHFDSWGGVCAGHPRCVLRADADHAVSVLFLPGAARVLRPPPPIVRIAAVRVSGAHRTVRFRFASRPPRVATLCALVRLRTRSQRAPRPRYAVCRSPKAYTHLRPGRYVFLTRAAQAGAVPARRAFTLR